MQAMELELGTLWSAAGILAGLQITAFSLRINRELQVGQSGDLTWLPLADLVNLCSLVVTALGVFLAPVLDLGGSALAAKAFGLAVLLLVGYPFALAGHYDMLNPQTHRSMVYCPRQEKVALAVVVAAAVVYIVLASVR